jgi:hypothetical protein
MNMKTASPTLLLERALAAPTRRHSLRRPTVCLASVALVGSGIVLTAILAILVAWAASLGEGDLLGGLAWMAGLGLLALGVDGSGKRAVAHLACGLVLLSTGWLASRVAPEFALVSAVVLGAAVSEGLWRLRSSWSGRRLEGEMSEYQRILSGGDRAEVA